MSLEFLVTIALCFSLGSLFIFIGRRNFLDAFMIAGIGAIMIGIIACLFLLIDLTKITTTKELYSLNVQDAQKSTFILGTGISKEKDYYVVYIENDKGGLELERYDAENSEIYMDLLEKEKPYVVITKFASVFTSYELHLPKDSVISEYNAQYK